MGANFCEKSKVAFRINFRGFNFHECMQTKELVALCMPTIGRGQG